MSVHIDTEGKRIKYIRETLLKMNLQDFATPLGKHLSAVQKWESGERKLDKSNLLLLEAMWSVNPDFIRSGVGEPFLQHNENETTQRPVYDILNKSYEEYLHLNKASTYIDIILPSAALFVKAINDDTPGIVKGDIVAISKTLPKDHIDGQYLVALAGKVALKYLCFVENDMIVLLENSQRLPIKLSVSVIHEKDIVMIGRVFTVIQNPV